MIEMIRYLSKCNMAINDAMLSSIFASEKKPYDTHVDGYYKTIGEILDHHYVADIIWIHTFRQVHESDIFNISVFEKIPQWGERQSDSIESFILKRKDLDRLIIRFVDELSEEDLDRTICRVTKSGEKLERIFWKAFLHMFNHGTHHRGQISQILDALGIANDYSNMIRIE